MKTATGGKCKVQPLLGSFFLQNLVTFRPVSATILLVWIHQLHQHLSSFHSSTCLERGEEAAVDRKKRHGSIGPGSSLRCADSCSLDGDAFEPGWDTCRLGWQHSQGNRKGLSKEKRHVKHDEIIQVYIPYSLTIYIYIHIHTPATSNTSPLEAST